MAARVSDRGLGLAGLPVWATKTGRLDRGYEEGLYRGLDRGLDGV